MVAIFEILLTSVIVFLIAEFIGYWFHRLAHLPRSKSLYLSHMVHHRLLYPPTRFASEHYLSAGNNNFVWWFLPIYIVLNTVFYILLPLFLFFIALSVISLISVLNILLHDSFHLKKTFLSKFKYYQKLRGHHAEHHKDMSKNFGIYTFIFDRLFNTVKVKPKM